MLDYLGKKYFHVFTAGKFPQGEVTVPMLHQVAASYNTGFHEAPLWVGHLKPEETKVGDDEPKALGWIDSAIVIDDKLYVSFSHLSDQAKWLIESQTFKYVSCEFGFYVINGVKTLYLFALALTNRPAVNNLEPLNLSQQYTDHVINKNYMGARLTFEQINTSFNLNKNTMNQILLDIAKAMGIDVAKYTTDAALADAIKLTHSDNAAKLTAFTSEMQTLKTEVDSLKKSAAPPAGAGAPPAQDDPASKRIESLEAMLFTNTIDDAIKAGKVLPAQRDSMIALAKMNFAECKKLIDATPVNSVYAEKSVKPAESVSVDLTNPKFTMDGKRLTYSEVVGKPELLGKFTDAELEALKAGSV